MAIPSLSLRASVRLPYHVSSPRSPNRTCGFPASRLSSGIMRLAHRSLVAAVDDSYGIGTRPPLHPRPGLLTPRRRHPHQTTPSLWHVMVSGPFAGVSGFRHSRDPGPSVTAPHLRPLPSTGITRLPWYLASFRFGACLTTCRASHVATFAFTRGFPVARFRLRPSPFLRWVGPRIPHCPFRGLLDVHSRSGPHVR